MASLINATNIDADYPVAGVDNDSQGFRDNFSTIKTSLTAAKDEIETLQNDTAKLNEGNNFLGNTISNAMLSATSEHYFNGGEISQASQEVNFVNGHYQRFAIQDGATVELELLGFPGEDNKLSKITIELVKGGEGDNPVVNFSSGASGQIRTNGTLDLPITLGNATYPTIIEFWTHDGGLTIYGQSLGQFNAV
jgi:hypothetical protein